MHRLLYMVNGNEDLVGLFGITGQLDSRRSLMARVQGCIQLYKSRRRTRRQPLQTVSFLSETVRGDAAKFQQYNACGGDPSMFASMTAVIRLPTSTNGGQAVSMQPDCLLGTPSGPCMGVRVLMYVVVETHFR